MLVWWNGEELSKDQYSAVKKAVKKVSETEIYQIMSACEQVLTGNTIAMYTF